MRQPILRRVFPVLALVTVVGLVACGSKSAEDPEPAAVEVEATDERIERDEADAKPMRIGQGEPVDLAAYTVDGKITVFDFMSDYCPPCVQISPWLDRLHAERADIQVVKIDINRPGVRGIDWQSPTLRQFGIRSIPHFKIYGADGELMQEGQPAYQQIVGWIQALPQEPQSGR